MLARQQTLLASVEWSHELLAPDERAVFRRLGAFTGPFPLDAAEAVCGDPGDAGWAVFDVLSRLVDKSLVVHDPDTDWYRLLETIRLYAVDRCRETGELEATRDRHATWWSVWLGTHHPDGPSDSDLDAIHLAYPNLRAALQWAATTEPELALELAGGLGIYWYLRGLFGDALTLGDLALASSAERGPAWARAVGRMAMPRYYANDETYMTTVVAEACAIADATGDQLTPLRCQATGVMTIEDSEEFRDLARRAEACGDLWVAGRMHTGAALWGVLLGEPDAPIALERAAAIAEQLDASSLRVRRAPHRCRAARRRAQGTGGHRSAGAGHGPRRPGLAHGAHGVHQPRQLLPDLWRAGAVRAGDQLPGGLAPRLGSHARGSRPRCSACPSSWVGMFRGTGRTSPWPGSMPARCGSSPSSSARTR